MFEIKIKMIQAINLDQIHIFIDSLFYCPRIFDDF